MAQETRITPIEIDDSTSQILNTIASGIDRRNAARDDKEKERMRIEAEEQKRIYQQNKEMLSSVFDPTKLRSETKAAMVNDILANSTAFLRKGMKGGTDAQVADNALQALVNISAGDAKYANIIKGIDERAKSLTDDEKKGLNIGQLTQFALKNALKKQDAKGNWVPKSNDELDDSQDYLGTVINSPDGLKFANLSVGYDDLTKEITEAPKSTETKNIKVQRGRTRTSESQKVTFSPKFQYYDEQAEEIKLKTDANGFIQEDVYKEITAKPSINRTLTSRAMTFIEDYNKADDKGRAAMAVKAGLPANATVPAVLDGADAKTIENIKKSFLTQTIANQIGITQAESKQDIILPPPSNNNYFNNWNNTDPTNTAPNDRVTAVISLDSRYLGPVTETKGGNKMYDVTGQFNNLPLFKTRSGKTYGPAEVKYNAGTQQFFVRQQQGQSLQTYDIQSFRDVIVPATSGTGYSPKPKGTPR